MAKNFRRTRTATAAATFVQRPEMDTEVANRMRDPFENTYMGLVRTNDPLLLERGGGGSDDSIYRDLERDPKVASGLQKRVLALVSRDWQAEAIAKGPRAEADAATLTAILKACSFDKICQDLMKALLGGIAISEVVWTIVNGQVVPKRVIKRARRRFVFKQIDENQPPELRLLTRDNMLDGEALRPKKFIVHRINPEDDNPWGTGLGLILYWLVFFKRKGIVSWNKLCERLGIPTVWGKYPRGSGPKEKATLFDALKALNSDGAVVTPEGTAIELLESKLTGSITTQQALVEYMDDCIAEVILGQEPRKQGGGALAAASKERSAVRLDLTQADSDLLSETLNSTLIPWICEFNGLVPCRVYRQIKEEEDLKAASETDKNVSGMGFKPTLASVKSRYGEGWEEAAPPAPAPGPGPANLALPKPGDKVVPLRPGAVAFAEGDQAVGQQAIDEAIAAVSDVQLRDALGGLFEPLMQAIEGASTFEDALAAAESAYPRMRTDKLQSLLARAMFGAETFARVSDD